MAQSIENAASTANLHREISQLRHELKTTTRSHPASSERIRVGDYLIERLVQLGVTVRPPSEPVTQYAWHSEFVFGRPSSAFREISTSVSAPRCSPERWPLLTAVTNIGFLVRALSCLIALGSRYLIRTLSKTTPGSIGRETGERNNSAPNPNHHHTFRLILLLSNELNAAYAADGFARVKEGSVGAVVTTSVIHVI